MTPLDAGEPSPGEEATMRGQIRWGAAQDVPAKLPDSGAALGALIDGELRPFGILLAPEFKLVFIYALIVIVLSWRPPGLMGKRLADGH